MRTTLIVLLAFIFCSGLAVASTDSAIVDSAASCVTSENATLAPIAPPAFDEKSGLANIGGTCTETCLAENRECEESAPTCAIVFEICVDLCENPPPF